MTSRDFCFWLQGFFELSEVELGEQTTLTISQTKMIKEHLALVFQHDIGKSTENIDKLKTYIDSHIGTQPISTMFC